MTIKIVKLMENHFEKELHLDENESLLTGLLANKVKINHSCGGMGTCGTCLVNVENFEDNPRGPIEMEMATERSFSDSERLACQIKPVHQMRVILKPSYY